MDYHKGHVNHTFGLIKWIIFNITLYLHNIKWRQTYEQINTLISTDIFHNLP